MEFNPFTRISTRLVHAGSEPDQWGNHDLVPPICLSSTFRQSEPGVFPQYDYGRCGNPTRNALEKALAAADNAQYSVTFGSGTAALSAILHLLKPGDHVITMQELYGGTITYFKHVAEPLGISFTFTDCTDLQCVSESFRPTTRLVWLESPSNPTMTVIDIPRLSALVKAHNPQILIAVDNTFNTPYFMRPLELGADISHQSCTKYMCGHLDVMMGSIAVNDEALAKRLRFFQVNIGAVPSPFDCYLMMRSLKTLAVRMREHMKNGMIVGRFLERHPHVELINHPGLPSHPQHALFVSQTRGHSGVLSFRYKGSKAQLWTFFRSLKVFTLAASLGGCESIVSYPRVMTHDGICPKLLDSVGITENLVRLSVGLEDVQDLLEDLEQAFRASKDGLHAQTVSMNGHSYNKSRRGSKSENLLPVYGSEFSTTR